MVVQQTQTKPQGTDAVAKKKYIPPQITRHGSLVSRTQNFISK